MGDESESELPGSLGQLVLTGVCRPPRALTVDGPGAAFGPLGRRWRRHMMTSRRLFLEHSGLSCVGSSVGRRSVSATGRKGSLRPGVGAERPSRDSIHLPPVPGPALCPGGHSHPVGPPDSTGCLPHGRLHLHQPPPLPVAPALTPVSCTLSSRSLASRRTSGLSVSACCVLADVQKSFFWPGNCACYKHLLSFPQCFCMAGILYNEPA